MLNKKICYNCASAAFETIFPQQVFKWQFNKRWEKDNFCLCPLFEWNYEKTVEYRPSDKHRYSTNINEKITNPYYMGADIKTMPPTGCAYSLEHVVSQKGNADEPRTSPD